MFIADWIRRRFKLGRWDGEFRIVLKAFRDGKESVVLERFNEVMEKWQMVMSKPNTPEGHAALEKEADETIRWKRAAQTASTKVIAR